MESNHRPWGYESLKCLTSTTSRTKTANKNADSLKLLWDRLCGYLQQNSPTKAPLASPGQAVPGAAQVDL
jgi:hypothetical protein